MVCFSFNTALAFLLLAKVCAPVLEMLILTSRTADQEANETLCVKEGLGVSFEIFPPFEDDTDTDSENENESENDDDSNTKDDTNALFKEFKKTLLDFKSIKMAILSTGIKLLSPQNSLLIPITSLTLHSTLSDNENEANGVLLLQVDSPSFEMHGKKVNINNIIDFEGAQAEAEGEDIIYHIYITGPTSSFEEAEDLYKIVSEKLEMPENAIINN